ncbi:hypothetical protein LCGC14_0346490 [marine sediment metagenome]|uniref:Uncharacterized protein n=1 Tax=marine sediment metagenome TaxID=412755 RepID=A0A0F9TV96_9ZZZZ
MASDFKWKAPTVALTNLLTTELNALANNVIKVSAEVNNETNLATHMDLEVTLSSLDLSAQTNPSITIYMFESVDGGTDFDTNEDGVSADTDIPTQDKVIAIMGLRVDTAAEVKTAVKSMIPIPPGRWKLGFRNTTGQTLGATVNILAYRTYILNLP